MVVGGSAGAGGGSGVGSRSLFAPGRESRDEVWGLEGVLWMSGGTGKGAEGKGMSYLLPLVLVWWVALWHLGVIGGVE